MRKQLLYYALRYQGNTKRISQAIMNNEPYEEVLYEGDYFTIVDDIYPKQLLRLKYKPWVLFYKGDLSLLQAPCISIVGSRECSEQAASNIHFIMSACNSSYTIVSGLAKGVDALAHQTAMHTHKNTIAVLGCGVDICYPKENLKLFQDIGKEHLILSEYPNGCKPLAHHFPWRNRIVAALSHALVVVEAKQRSGTMISVNEALEIGNEVYCFPYRFEDSFGLGCNLLIQNGAQIICTKKDIEEM